MPFITRQSLFALTLLFVGVVVAAGTFVWSGVYNIGADDTHTKPVYSVLQALREKSIEHHTRGLEVPDLTDANLIRSGAGNYDAMCTGCHLAPGRGETELSKGLYPVPPNFSRLTPNDPAHDFWVIKHGIKASGMPAWGRSMEDRYIWGMVAFLQEMPALDADGYQALVTSSGGHSHGGGETASGHDAGEAEDNPHGEGIVNQEGVVGAHSHEDGAAADSAAATGPSPATTPPGTTHVHADGKRHVHASPQTVSAPAAPAKGSASADTSRDTKPAPQATAEPDDGHGHQH